MVRGVSVGAAAFLFGAVAAVFATPDDLSANGEGDFENAPSAVAATAVPVVEGTAGSSGGSAAVQPVPPLPEGVRLTLEADRTELSIGDRFTVRLTLEVPIDRVAEMPHGVAQLGQFEVRSFSSSEPKKIGKGLKRLEWSYELALFGTGEFLLPPLVVSVSDTSAGIGWALMSDPVLLSVVARPIAADSDIEPDDAPVPSRAPIPAPLPIALAALLLIGGAILLLRRRRAIAAEPPHTRALREIERLLTSGDGSSEEQSRHNLFSLKLGLTLRGYLDRRFGLETLEKTTEELLVHLNEAPAELDPWRGQIEQFCRRTDRIKFAGEKLERGEAEHLAGEVRALVVGTQSVADESQAKGGSGK